MGLIGTRTYASMSKGILLQRRPEKLVESCYDQSSLLGIIGNHSSPQFQKRDLDFLYCATVHIPFLHFRVLTLCFFSSKGSAVASYFLGFLRNCDRCCKPISTSLVNTLPSVLLVGMPQAKLKPSDIAAEAKRRYIPYVEQTCPQWPAGSYFYSDSSELRVMPKPDTKRKLRVAVIDGDLVDVAIGWDSCNIKNTGKEEGTVPIVSMANEKRAGGDWESGLLAPEECLCRRSNLVRNLTTPRASSNQASHYPIPPTGGIYSPQVGELLPRAYRG